MFQKIRLAMELVSEVARLVKLTGGVWTAGAIRDLGEETLRARNASKEMTRGMPRSEVINSIISVINASSYLEIGVRNPADNFNLIKCDIKHSVDPGMEFDENPVDFPVTSDTFFEGVLPGSQGTYDVVFIDGLHHADQAYRDIGNAISRLSPSGVVILHDCMPPTRWHARYIRTLNGPARFEWNGTTWKAFWRFALESEFACNLLPLDFGLGVIDTCGTKERVSNPNPFFEYELFHQDLQDSDLLCGLDDLLASLVESRTRAAGN